MSRINETLKNMIDEVDPDRRLDELVEQAEKLYHSAVAKAGAFAHDRREDIDARMDRATDFIEDRTGERWSDHVDQVRDRLELGLDRLAERRPDKP